MAIRAFISIDVEPSDRMVQFHSDLKQANAPIKLVNLDSTHLTLKFLGQTREELVPEISRLMERCVEGLTPFDIHFKGAGAFPSLRHIRVVWIGVEDAEMMKSMADFLNDELEILGFKKERREFSPHLTLGRVKGGRGKQELMRIIEDWKKEEFGSMRVDAIRLKKSELGPKGPSYSTLAEARLGN